jgi:hypothetical protein
LKPWLLRPKPEPQIDLTIFESLHIIFGLKTTSLYACAPAWNRCSVAITLQSLPAHCFVHGSISSRPSYDKPPYPRLKDNVAVRF